MNRIKNWTKTCISYNAPFCITTYTSKLNYLITF